VSEESPPRIANGLSGPPRLREIRQEEITPRHREAIRQSMEFMDDSGDGAGDDSLHPFPATMCRHVEIFDRYMAFGMNILKNALIEPREREILTLRTGWLCDAPFEWGAHVHLGLEAGLTVDEIERIKIGPDAGGWSGLDKALLSAVDELNGNATISDATWVVLSAHLDDLQLIELPMIVGQYHMTAFFQNALRFRPVRDMAGVELPEEAVAS
jgi:4-carboxymuconolactone decarboxylase